MNLTRQFIFCSTILLLLSSCKNFPKDPSHTLEKVKNGTLLVGYSENPPFVIKTSHEPTGLEADLVKAFANTLNARLEWRNDTEARLFESLKKKEIHLVIAGITKDTPWQDKAGITRPYLETKDKKYVMALQLGENAFLIELEKFLEAHKEQIEKKASL
ncbi:transporter substrate-binding domain-containing protein [Rhodocytophaga rosea]|uniref:Transporter substrate-binding domain-containing protein n=1 Tax=Rhodocytophaga rosea TaxID=2704465 RepID=A0A6C0GFI7_9BACT|nr:transporter substrate-binding domain-containing protein [Rhodocytophaga rosea]QHT66738.1 transporter substrate-binding domain-containing protein [Rhodocytophaga rosea]